MAITQFEITDIKTVARSTLLYIEVDFYDGETVVHRNDFAMQISPTQRIYIGPPLDPGDPDPIPDPGDYEIVETDVRAVILANIRRYIDRVDEGLSPPFDARSTPLRRTKVDTDPLGLRGKPGVSDLVGGGRIDRGPQR